MSIAPHTKMIHIFGDNVRFRKLGDKWKEKVRQIDEPWAQEMNEDQINEYISVTCKLVPGLN